MDATSLTIEIGSFFAAVGLVYYAAKQFFVSKEALKQAKIDKFMDGLKDKDSEIDKRLAALEKDCAVIEERVDNLEEMLDKLDAKLDHIIEKI